MEAQHEKRVKLVFWMRELDISRMEVENGYGDVAKNLTFRIRTTSTLIASDKFYPGKERGTHVSILCLVALTLTSQP